MQHHNGELRNRVWILLGITNLLCLVLVGLLGYWMASQTSRLLITELSIQDLRTWRETIHPISQSDHQMLMQLANEMIQRAATLEQMVSLVRDLKVLFDNLSTQQITMRESIYRIESHTDGMQKSLNGRHR